jgi:myo-inositol-1(or 4)-monophosphatase
LCMVAAGMLDAYYEDTTSRWDWAAGALIAAEAGARVEVAGDGLVVAGPALFAPLRSALTTAGAL